jgi:hypothetical protein
MAGCIAAVVSTTVAPAAQIVHFWDFETDFADTIGSGGGTAGVDVSTGTGHDGNTAAVFPATVSGGGPFTSAGYVGTTGVDISGPFAMSYWIRMADDGSTNPRGIFDFSGNGGDGPQSLYIGTSNSLAFRFDGISGGGAALYTAPGGLEDDRWHFVAANYDPATGIELFVDGVSVASAAGAFGDAVGGWSTDQYLGAFNVNITDAVRGLNGGLDDVAIYSGSLTPAHVAALFEGRIQPTQVPEPATIALAAAALALVGNFGRRRG